MNSRKKLLVTGAHGFVAGSVITQAGAEWELHAVSRGAPLLQRAGLRWHQCDPLARSQLSQLFREVQPNAVIHTAALADIDFCQAQPDAARRVNVDLTRTLADLCTGSCAMLVFCSTDNVFDCERAPYRETDVPAPVNYYGATKAEAERFVASRSARAVVARLALVMGLPVLGAGNSFLARLIAALKAGKEVGVPAAEVRTPVDVITLGRALLELAEGTHAGVFHLAGLDPLNRLELSQHIAARLGLPSELIIASDTSRLIGRAPRPRDVSLDSGRARAALRTPMRSFDDGLSLVLEQAHTPPP